MPHAASLFLCKMSCQGLPGWERKRRVLHLVALRLSMQREKSRRIAKLYEFTGKVGLGSNI
jgi:hypothetical protein